jgi:hypothetical protein
MKVKARIVIMSHLSDVQEELGSVGQAIVNMCNNRINFAKYIIIKYPDTNTEIDPDAEYEIYQNR